MTIFLIVAPFGAFGLLMLVTSAAVSHAHAYQDRQAAKAKAVRPAAAHEPAGDADAPMAAIQPEGGPVKQAGEPTAVVKPADAGEGASALAHARSLAASVSPDAGRLIFNDNLNAALSIFFMLVVAVVILASAREWYLVAVGRKAPKVNETPYVETALAS